MLRRRSRTSRALLSMVRVRSVALGESCSSWSSSEVVRITPTRLFRSCIHWRSGFRSISSAISPLLYHDLLLNIQRLLHYLVRRCDHLCVGLVAALEGDDLRQLGRQIDVGKFQRTAHQFPLSAVFRSSDSSRTGRGRFCEESAACRSQPIEI